MNIQEKKEYNYICFYYYQKTDENDDSPRYKSFIPHKICHYYSKPGGCPRGDKCTFKHENNLTYDSEKEKD